MLESCSVSHTSRKTEEVFGHTHIDADFLPTTNALALASTPRPGIPTPGTRSTATPGAGRQASNIMTSTSGQHCDLLLVWPPAATVGQSAPVTLELSCAVTVPTKPTGSQQALQAALDGVGAQPVRLLAVQHDELLLDQELPPGMTRGTFSLE